jgi:hypothetical protein
LNAEGCRGGVKDVGENEASGIEFGENILADLRFVLII